MAAPTRHTAPGHHEPGPGPEPGRPLGVRQWASSLGLLAVLVCGIGLTLRQASQASPGHLATAALGTLVAVMAAVAVVRGRRQARTAARHPGVLPLEEEIAAAEREAMPELLPDLHPEPGPEGVPEAVPDPAPERCAEPCPEEEVRGAYDAMDADAFEQAVAALCERDGCRDVGVVGGANDLGADVVATRPDGRRIVIQCKRYCATNKVGSQELQRFGGTCFTVHEADVAVLVTTSSFTEPAVDYAAHTGIRCFDGAALAAWAERTGPAPWE
ncbi:restriction endonuclease [Streptomyces sp. WAC 00631]|uniref:restriction endonuclease n=1 Tax=Streptomyces sp. WAC 00631 TaxID=2203201 RepID=UPI001E3471DF|nr:restriction endonuclease [Streptomyces sp. WAC 00631]MCC5037061.1 restriction endonuclease [Streptomyces sp. WAC 00631]